MGLPHPSGALILAARALGGASTAAHLAFLSLYAYRFIVGRGFRFVSAVCALLAAIGLTLSFVGGALLKHGGRTKARGIGVWLVGGATTLASLLLVFTSSGD